MCNAIDTEGQRLNAKLTLINLHRGPGAREKVNGRQQMEMVTKAHELCAAVKTIKIYKGGRPVGEGRRAASISDIGSCFSLAYKAPIFTLATFANGALRK